MKEDYEEGHTPVNLSKPQPGSGSEQDASPARQALDGEREESSGDSHRESIYKEGTHCNQGEYHDTAQDRQNTYGQGFEPPHKEPEQPVSQGFGIASLSLGIVSLVLFCTCINVPVAILAVIFGILQLTKPETKKGMAIGGIITAALSLFLFLVFIIGFFGSINYRDGIRQELQRSLERQFEDRFLEDYVYPDDDWENDWDDDWDEDRDLEDDFLDDTF